MEKNISQIKPVWMLLKWQIKKLGFQLRDVMNPGMKKKVVETFYRTTIRSGKTRKKSVEECQKTRNDK